MKWWWLCCGGMLAIGQSYAEEARSSQSWLKTMAVAGHQTEYSGVFVYQYANRLETTRITHLMVADGEFEKLESLDDSKREIVRHHGQVYQNQKLLQVEGQLSQSGFPALLSEQSQPLLGNYEIKELGAGSVAGYAAQILLFQPRDGLRYAHKFWVNADTGLLLKAAVLGERNQAVEQYAFTQLKIGGNQDRTVIASSPAGKTNLTNAKTQDNGATPYISGWVVDGLPAGFKKITEVQRAMRGKHAPVSQLVYSDGLCALSVFIEPNDTDEDDVEGLTNRGASNLYHKVVDGHLYTVVGEVPPRTVMQVLDSIRYNGK